MTGRSLSLGRRSRSVHRDAPLEDPLTFALVEAEAVVERGGRAPPGIGADS
jgi:hypothetical protein